MTDTVAPKRKYVRRWTAERPALNVRLRRKEHGLTEGEVYVALYAKGTRNSQSRPGNLSDERAAAIVRGILLDRLDHVLGANATRFAEEFKLSRTQWLNLVQAVCLCLFPEEFESDGHAEATIAANRAAADAARCREAAGHATNDKDRREALDLADRFDEVSRQCRRGGLVPVGGKLERGGVARLRVFAQVLERAAG